MYPVTVLNPGVSVSKPPSREGFWFPLCVYFTECVGSDQDFVNNTSSPNFGFLLNVIPLCPPPEKGNCFKFSKVTFLKDKQIRDLEYISNYDSPEVSERALTLCVLFSEKKNYLAALPFFIFF